LLERCRIIDKIRFAQRDGEDPPSENRLAQPARHGFDFRKFGHKRYERSKIAQRREREYTKRPTGAAVGTQLQGSGIPGVATIPAMRRIS